MIGSTASMQATPASVSENHELYHFFVTGCDTTSFFKGKGKKSAWAGNGRHYEEVTETLYHLASHTFEHLNDDSDHFKTMYCMAKLAPPRPLSIETREELFCTECTSPACSTGSVSRRNKWFLILPKNLVGQRTQTHGPQCG